MRVKRVFRDVGKVTGFLIAFAGLILMMCETESLERQTVVTFSGLGVFLIGALICAFSFEKDGVEDVL